MSIAQGLLPEFDMEMPKTRKTLERIPHEKFSFKPHAKSWAMGGLATHLANIPTWAVLGIENDSFDLAPGGERRPQIAEAASPAELLALFDKNVVAARAAIAGASDEHLLANWSLLMNGKVMMTVPRLAVVRQFVMNHMIHHRAQLGVYLRLNDLPVPSVYGPSADESPF